MKVICILFDFIHQDDNKNKPMSRALELEDDYDDNDSWDHRTDVRYEVCYL